MATKTTPDALKQIRASSTATGIDLSGIHHRWIDRCVHSGSQRPTTGGVRDRVTGDPSDRRTRGRGVRRLEAVAAVAISAASCPWG
jgi:hypothetical protein